MIGPKISVIIPSRDGTRGGNVPRLIEDLAAQTRSDFEVILVVGARPNGHARNVGARRARGEVLVMLDDDLRLGTPELLDRLVTTLLAHPEFGMVGASQQLPPDAGPFQKRSARELPRSTFPIVDECTDTDMVNHCAGFAIRASLYRSVGGEDDELERGTDPDLREKVRRAGYRVVVAPGAPSYHPLPDSLREFWRYHYSSGAGTARVHRRHRDRIVDVSHGPEPLLVARRPIWWRAIRFAGRAAGALLSGRRFLLVSYLAYAAGFLSGLLRRHPSPVGDGAVTIYGRDDLLRTVEAPHA